MITKEQINSIKEPGYFYLHKGQYMFAKRPSPIIRENKRLTKEERKLNLTYYKFKTPTDKKIDGQMMDVQRRTQLNGSGRYFLHLTNKKKSQLVKRKMRKKQ